MISEINSIFVTFNEAKKLMVEQLKEITKKFFFKTQLECIEKEAYDLFEKGKIDWQQYFEIIEAIIQRIEEIKNDPNSSPEIKENELKELENFKSDLDKINTLYRNGIRIFKNEIKKMRKDIGLVLSGGGFTPK